MSKKLLEHRLRLSETELRRGGLVLLEQAYKEGCARIEETRLKLDLPSFGDAVVTVTVEQWVDEQ